ncbi:ABC transporter permease [Arthrobacter bambusae]|uniref:ABC transporter permease n=1 Tax=Arthrobacter bambusae TaxID=1338426 RepID=UPI002786E1E6|nr:ABC transporter permease subunit [Arthrobacter bambusae]MDQ0029410.1 putative spermidine/putrescine transport system permease protein [Arthrobacter bambusae]MDQ0097070.1 putative spermidine/putrescine transport system permease protein [Arthrobacter bambusae]
MAINAGSRAASRIRRPLTLDSIVRSALVGLFVVLMVVFILGPLLWLGVRAFAGNWTFPHLLPDDWTLRWWQVVINDGALGIAVQNSLFFAPLTVLVSAIICLPAAYAFARFEFPGRRFFLISLFATNAFPKMGLFVTLAALFYALNLMNSVLGILVVHVLGTVVFMTWIPAAAFAAVPRNLEEAARDAGASKLRVFASVTLPMALPGIIVAAVMSFLASFDEAQGTYLVGAPAFMTMPTQMYSLVLNYPTQVAAVFSILLAIPSVALMLAAHKHILGGQLAEGFQIK